MTPAEADRRIIHSRTVFHRYLAMTNAGLYPTKDIGLMADEIVELMRIAASHPIKSEKIARLVADWTELQGRLRGKLN